MGEVFRVGLEVGVFLCRSRGGGRGANLLFQLISDLSERVSIIIPSNLRFQEWTSIFGSETLTQSATDRLTHRGNIFEFVSESYRHRHRLQQNEKKDKGKR